jgi:hypothetical protein
MKNSLKYASLNQDPGQQAQAKIAIQKNALIQNVQENEYIRDAIRVGAMSILNEVYKMDRRLAMKEKFVQEADRICAAIRAENEKSQANGQGQ